MPTPDPPSDEVPERRRDEHRQHPGVGTMIAQDERSARWPWAVLAGFIAVAALGTVLVAANGESLGAQVPYIIAFSMFGAFFQTEYVAG